MFGPGMGGFGGMGFGPRPMPPMGFYHRRGSSILGVGLTAMLGSMLGTSIANKNNNQQYSTNSNYNNYNSSNRVYELYNYCPNCGAKRESGTNYCGYCGSSMVK